MTKHEVAQTLGAVAAVSSSDAEIWLRVIHGELSPDEAEKRIIKARVEISEEERAEIERAKRVFAPVPQARRDAMFEALQAQRRADMTLDRLVRGATNGKARAFIRLILAVERRVQRVFRRQGVPERDRGDLANEALLRVCEHLRELSTPGENIEAWIGKVGRNLARDYHACAPREGETLRGCVVEATSVTHSIEHVFGQVPRRAHEVFELHMLGYSHAEIGGELGMSEETSRAILAGARSRLRRALREDPPMPHGA